MARVPNWGPSAGKPVPDEQWAAYMQANPPPEGASFTAAQAVAPEGTGATTLGFASGTSGANAGLDPANNRPSATAAHGAAPVVPSWTDFFRQQRDKNTQARNPYSYINSEQSRLEQQRVINDLQRQAAGDPNSLAQQQLGAGYRSAQAQQSSLGSTMRGQGAGAAMRGIQQGQQGIQRGFAGDQQMLMLQEQQAAQAMLAQMLAQQQQQDIAQAQGMVQGNLGAQGLNQAMQQFYTSGMIGQMLGDYQHGADKGRAQLGFDLEAQDVAEARRRAAMNAVATAGGTLLSFGGGGSGGDNSYQGPVPDWEDPADTNWAPFPKGG